MTTALSTRGWTVQEPPTDNDNDVSANTYFLTKTYTLFGGRDETHYSILQTEANTDDTVYKYWDGNQADVADGYITGSSSVWWGGQDFSPSYSVTSGAFRGTWEMWASDEDSDSYIVIGGASGNKSLIGWGEPTGTRYVGDATYNHFPIGGMFSGPQIMRLGNSSASYVFRASIQPYDSFMTVGDGPFLINYPALNVQYSSSRTPWGRISTSDWLELVTVSSSPVSQAISATTYNGENYIKIGGTVAWVMNTGATVPVL